MGKKILIGVLVIVVALVIWLATLPAKYDFTRSMEIDADFDVVYENVSNFKRWDLWSPWTILDATNQNKYFGTQGAVGGGYSWEGELTGAGEMEIIELKGKEFIDMDIRFTKPWKSESDVTMALAAVDSNTVKVTWGMAGKMPFLMRWMTKSMEGFIGMDYDRGLLMLKELSETGEVISSVEYAGIVDFDEINFVGLKHQVSVNEMGVHMENDFKKLLDLHASTGVEMVGEPLSVYYNVDFANDKADFATGIQLKGAADMELQGDFMKDKISGGKALKIIHRGKYEHSGNAWTGGYSYARTKKIKLSKKVAPFELYLTDPNEVPNPKDWVTEIYLPVK